MVWHHPWRHTLPLAPEIDGGQQPLSILLLAVTHLCSFQTSSFSDMKSDFSEIKCKISPKVLKAQMGRSGFLSQHLRNSAERRDLQITNDKRGPSGPWLEDEREKEKGYMLLNWKLSNIYRSVMLNLILSVMLVIAVQLIFLALWVEM